MIASAHVFSKLDLKDAFNQIPVNSSQRHLTAFKCKFGIFEYKVMPFGLRNAPSVFQRIIDNTLVGLVGICCVAYLDDILVFSPDVYSHKQDLFKFFRLSLFAI